MKSTRPEEDDVVNDLGDKIIDGLGLMVAQTRDDLRVYRQAFPRWASQTSERGMSNWIHDRLWGNAAVIFDPIAGVKLYEHGVTREILVDIRYRLRVKRHDLDGQVGTMPTQTALSFMAQDPATLDGLAEIRLLAGYIWDGETRNVGAPVISLRDGLDNVIWVHQLAEPNTGVVSTTPILPATQPTAPTIELSSNQAVQQKAADSQ